MSPSTVMLASRSSSKIFRPDDRGETTEVRVQRGTVQSSHVRNRSSGSFGVSMPTSNVSENSSRNDSSAPELWL